MKPPGLDPTIGTLAVLAAFALGAGGIYAIRRGERQKGLLMLGCALVVLGNLAIWAI